MQAKSLRSLFGRLIGRNTASRAKASKSPRHRSLSLEPLENRHLLSIALSIDYPELHLHEEYPTVWKTLTITNNGPDPASGVITWSSNDFPPGGDGICSYQEGYGYVHDYMTFNDLDPGESTTIDVVPINDPELEGTRSYLIEASAGLGGSASLEVTVEDNDDWQVKLELIENDDDKAQEEWEDETQTTYGDASFHITRYGETDTSHSCRVIVRVNPDSTVTTGEYIVTYGVGYTEPDDVWQEDGICYFEFTIPQGATSVPVKIIPVDDQVVEPVEELILDVVKGCGQFGPVPVYTYYSVDCVYLGTGNYPPGSPSSLTITFEDNDFAIKADPGHAEEPEDIEDWDGASEETDGATIGTFHIYRESGFNLERGIVISVPAPPTQPVLDSDEDDLLEGDYELRWVTNGNELLPDNQDDWVIEFKAGDATHSVDVIPFYDTIGEPAEDVIMDIIDCDDEVDNAVQGDLLGLIEVSTAVVGIAKSPEKPCVCSCSMGDESGGASAGVNATIGTLGTGDAQNNVTHYSYFANDQQVILADSGLTIKDGGDNTLTYVKAELFFNNAGTANETIWFDGSITAESPAVANVKYSFAFSADVSGLPTGMYDWEVKLTEYYVGEDPDGTKSPTQTLGGTASVFNTATIDNPVGDGWFIFGIPKIIIEDGVSDRILLRGGLQRFEFITTNTWRQGASDDTSDYTLTRGYNFDYGQSVYTLTSKDGTVEIFDDPSGTILAGIDSNGNETKYTHDGAKLTEIERPGGLTTTYLYETDGPLIQATDPEGRTTLYGHDGNDRIVSITKADPDGAVGPLPAPVTTFEYDATSGLLNKIIAIDGGVTEIEYDFAGCVSKVTYPDGSVDEYESYYTSLLTDTTQATQNGSTHTDNYPAVLIRVSDGQVTVTSGGTTTTSEVGAWGFPREVTDAEGNVTTYIRNGNGQVLQMIEPDPDGDGPRTEAITYYEYDQRGNLAKMTLPSGLTREWTYDFYTNTMTKYVDGMGATTLYDVDWRTGNVLEERIVVGQVDDDENEEEDDIVTRYGYSPESTSANDIPGGLVVTKIGPSGRVVGYNYDTTGRLVETFVYADPTDLLTVDDSDENAFSVSGDWSEAAVGNEFNHHYGVGFSSSSAKWSIEGLVAGKTYEVYATWVAYDGNNYDNNNTDKALFSVHDEHDGGTLGPVLIEAAVDQTVAPTGHLVGGDDYQTLGRITVSDDTMTVVLSASPATNYYDLSADAIRIVEVESRSTRIYNPNTGELIAEVDAAGRVTEYEYDALGRLIEVLQPYADTTGQVVDDQEANGNDFAKTGTWTEVTSAGNDDDYRYATGINDGINDNVATWTFTVEKGKEYELFATWTTELDAGEPEHSEVAPYTVYDGTTAGIELDSLTVDQSSEPSGSLAFGDQWHSLGTYTTTDTTTLTVELTGVAGGDSVVADAIKLVGGRDYQKYFYDISGNQIATADSTGLIKGSAYDDGDRLIESFYYVDPDVNVTLDDGEPGYSAPEGSWTEIATGGYDSDYHYSTDSDAEAQWIISSGITAGKRYEVFATWYTDAANNTDGSLYSVYDDNEATGDPVFTKTVNQQVAPGGHSVAGDDFRSLGRITASDDVITVKLSRVDTDTQRLCADAIRLVEIETQTTYFYDSDGTLVAHADAFGNIMEYEHDNLGRVVKMHAPYPDLDAAVVKDENNKTASYQTWTQLTGSDWAYDGDYWYVEDNTSAYVAWSITGLEAEAPYEIWVTYGAGEENADDVLYYVCNGWIYGHDPVAMFMVDQTAAPSGSVVHGDQWHYLGTFTPSDDILSLRVKGNADGRVIADAVMTVPARATTETVYDAAGRVKMTINPLGYETAYAYDTSGRLISTTYPDTENRIDVETCGIVYAKDNATGAGYIMYSEESVHERFSAGAILVNNTDHFIAVRYYDDGGQWQYDNNGNYIQFTPTDTDRLIAEVDFDENIVTDLKGIDATEQDIAKGYAHGDLAFFAERVGTSSDVGEFTIFGSFFVATHADNGSTSTNAYDASGRLRGQEDALGHATASVYDDAGRVIEGLFHASTEGTIKDDTTGVVYVGTWETDSSGGYGGSQRYIAVDEDDIIDVYSATWTFAELNADTKYELLATWTPYETRNSSDEITALSAIDATYRVYDGSVSTENLLEETTVNQNYAPIGDNVLGVGWKSLGRFTLDSAGSLVVQLTDVATEAGTGEPPRYVLADAIQLLEVETQTIYTYDAASNLLSVEDALDNTTTYTYDDEGRRIQTMLADPDGEGTDYTSPVTYTYYDAVGQFTASISADLRVDTVEYDDAGRVVATYTGALADDSRSERFDTPTGTWTPVSNDGQFGSYERATTVTGAATATATWTFDGLVINDDYEVYVTWKEAAGNADDATFNIYQGSLSENPVSVEIDQTKAPGEATGSTTVAIPFSDEIFQKLGLTITASESTLIVELSNLSDIAGNTVVADAVYLVRKDATSTTTYDQAGRVVETQDVDGNTTTLDYNMLSQVTTVTYPDPDGTGTTYTSPIERVYYNQAGQAAATISSDLIVRTTEYDAVGRATAGYVGAVLDADADSDRYDETGSWTDGAAGFLDATRTIDSVTGTATATAEWTFDGLVLGEEYEVYATWTADADNNVDSATYKIYEGDSSTELFEYEADQTAAPGEGSGTTAAPIAFAGQSFELLGSFTTSESELTVELSNVSTQAGKTIVADAVYLLKKTAETQTVYNLAGQVVATIDAAGNQTDYTYNSLGQLIEATLPDPDGDGPLTRPRTQSVYNAAGQLIETIEYPGEALQYDQRGEGYDRVVGDSVDIGAYEGEYSLGTADYVVDTLVDESDGDYSSGDLSLREALYLASQNAGYDLITFDAGLSGTIQLTGPLGQLDVNSDVTIQGPGDDVLTIDANGSSGDNQRVFIVRTGVTAEISGLTLTGGYINVGGAIYSYGGVDLTLREVEISGNHATSTGGAIYGRGDNITILDSTITDNSSDSSAGGIYVQAERTYIEGTTISQNTAVNSGAGVYASYGSIEIVDSAIKENAFSSSSGSRRGAGVFLGYGVNATIVGTTIENNNGAAVTGGYDARYGGGIYFQTTGSDLIIEDSTIKDNIAKYYGGGVYARDGEVQIAGSVFDGNSTTYYGGGMYVTGATVSIDNSLFVDNAAAYYGGGIRLNGGATVNMTGSTVSGNSAYFGGGLYTSGSDSLLTLTNCTVTENTAYYYGGGIRRSWGSVTLYNTIVADNSANYYGPDLYGTFGSESAYNLIGKYDGSTGIADGVNGNLVGSSASPIDPQLGDLAYNGGPTMTYVPDSAGPAVNAGSALLADAPFDGRGEGFLRILGRTVDIGAVEYGSNAIIVSTLVDEDNGTGDLSLREAIGIANDRPGADVIQFSPALLSTSAVTIGGAGWIGSDIDITSNLTIEGPGADKLVIDADGDSRIFNISSDCTVTISGLTLTGGDVSDPAYKGGAIYASTSMNLTLDSVRLIDNEAYQGGALATRGGTLKIIDSEISGNVADGYGGGIHIYGTGDASFIQTTISGNTGSSGGAAYFYKTTLQLTNCTITENTGYSGSILATSAMLHMDNTIVAGNTGTYSDVYLYASIITSASSHNVIGSSSGLWGGLTDGVNGNQIGTSYNPIDPELGLLAFNGGATRTHAVHHGSPAVDAGSVEMAVTPADQIIRYEYDEFGRVVKKVMPGPNDRFQSYTINDDSMIQSGATGAGYVMLSEENISIRFSDNPPPSGSARYFVTVKYNGAADTWQYDDGTAYHDFESRSGDRLVAAVDFDTHQVTDLKGTNDVEHGILTGSAEGDFTFVYYSGNVRIDGMHIILNSPTYFTTYDAVGNVLTATNSLAGTTTHEYDNLYRQKSVTDAEGGVTEYTYDAAGRMAGLTDPEQNVTTWTYGLTGRMATETINVDSTDLVRYYEHDARGNLVRSIDRNGRVVELTYDNLGRRTGENWVDDVSADWMYTHGYDHAGRLTEVAEGHDDIDVNGTLEEAEIDGRFSYGYDVFGRLASTTQDLDGLDHDVRFDYAHDSLGQRTSVAVSLIDDATQAVTPDYVNRYVHDALGRTTRTTQSGVDGGNVLAEKRVDYLYNDLGRVASLTRFADLDGTDYVVGTDMVYDQVARLTDLTHRRADVVFADYDLDWDYHGQLVDFDFTSLVGDDGSADYDYDATGQLTDADYDYQTDEDYTYDDNGNRTNANGDNYTTGDHNRLASDGTYTYTHDNEGNRTSKTNISDSTSVHYEWDHRNRLVKATFKNATGTPTKIVEYAYDHGNRWVRKTLDTNADGTTDSSRIFVHDNGQIVLDFEHAGPGVATAADLSHRYLWGTSVDEILADETVDDGTADDVAWALTDHQNSVRDLVEYDPSTDTVSVTKHVTYDAFGNVASDTAPALNSLFLYTARPFDPDTALQNNLNRWYDLSTGRWISADPIPDDINPYRYVRNTPMTATDPNGLSPHPMPNGEPTIFNTTVAPHVEISPEIREFLAIGNPSIENQPGKFMLKFGPNSQTGSRSDSDVEVIYAVSNTDKVKYKRVFLTVWVKTEHRRHRCHRSDKITEWHNDRDQLPGQATPWPGGRSRFGPTWDDNPGAEEGKGSYSPPCCPGLCAPKSLDQYWEVCAIGVPKRGWLFERIGCITYSHHFKWNYSSGSYCSCTQTFSGFRNPTLRWSVFLEPQPPTVNYSIKIP